MMSSETAFPQQNYSIADDSWKVRSDILPYDSSIKSLSPVNQWIINNSLKEINVVDDQKVEVLSGLTCTSYNEIVYYLLQHGWNLKPAATGMQYVRPSSKDVLSTNCDSKCAKCE